MIQDDKKTKKVKTYEIDNKKYTIITSCVDGCESIDKLYDVLCKFAISKLDSEFNEMLS